MVLNDLPVVAIDSSQIQQLFQNLIGNSLKSLQEGIAPVVNILYNPSKNGDFEIVFEDNGIGFDEKYIEKIFQPFQRLHGKSAYEGTGMGLAICKKIVERYNGTITVKSTLGAGSTFIVTLPKKQTET